MARDALALAWFSRAYLLASVMLGLALGGACLAIGLLIQADTIIELNQLGGGGIPPRQLGFVIAFFAPFALAAPLPLVLLPLAGLLAAARQGRILWLTAWRRALEAWPQALIATALVTLELLAVPLLLTGLDRYLPFLELSPSSEGPIGWVVVVPVVVLSTSGILALRLLAPVVLIDSSSSWASPALATARRLVRVRPGLFRRLWLWSALALLPVGALGSSPLLFGWSGPVAALAVLAVLLLPPVLALLVVLTLRLSGHEGPIPARLSVEVAFEPDR